jgi:hypothetical protein
MPKLHLQPHRKYRIRPGLVCDDCPTCDSFDVGDSTDPIGARQYRCPFVDASADHRGTNLYGSRRNRHDIPQFVGVQVDVPPTKAGQKIRGREFSGEFSSCLWKPEVF